MIDTSVNSVYSNSQLYCTLYYNVPCTTVVQLITRNKCYVIRMYIFLMSIELQSILTNRALNNFTTIRREIDRRTNEQNVILYYLFLTTGDFMKKVPTATCALRYRQKVYIERVYTPSTYYMKSAVVERMQ